MALYNPFAEKDIIFTQTRSCHMLFAPKRVQDRTVSVIDGKPVIKGNCNTCFEDNGVRMKCGDYICPNDLLDRAWKQVEVMKYEITCTACSQIISSEDIIKFGLPNKEEELFLTTAITTNFYESQDFHECPQCRKYVQDRVMILQRFIVQFARKKEEILSCFAGTVLRNGGIWETIKFCGNSSCMRESIETLMSCPKKNFSDVNGKTISIPKWRACPNKSCSTLIEHTEQCNSMTCCKCRTEFCFTCLTVASGGSLDCKSQSYNYYIGIKCVPAPIQTKL